MDSSDIAEIVGIENQAYETFRSLIRDNHDLLYIISGHGDGECGTLLEILQEELLGASCRGRAPAKPTKKVIPQGLRTKVFERDAYRCVHCHSYKDLCADHIFPESKGGEAVFDNLQTLCRSCNSKKGNKA